MKFKLIVAVDQKLGIGKNNGISWKNKTDLRFFRKKTLEVPENSTKQNMIIMGRKTFDSIGKELPNRINVVLSRNKMENVLNFQDLKHLFLYIEKNKEQINSVFIIGGSQIYKLFLDLRIISEMYVSRIEGNYNCDIFLTENYENNMILQKTLIEKNNNEELKIDYYTFNNIIENKYLDLMKDILINGNDTLDRTKVGTLSKFGCSLTYDISNNVLPLLTTKRIFFRGIIEELFWFLSGSTDAKKLQERGVKIWDGNSSREFLDSRNLNHLEVGDIGAGYGFQLRHFGENYINCNSEYKGFDQLKYVIDLIKTDPNSRRILFSYWNPKDLNTVSLNPCHLLYQFYCNIKTQEISCCLYQRSSDYFLANNFNVVSAVVLTHLIGYLTGYTPKNFTHFMGDTHIYKNHIEQTKIQLTRKPKNFPLLFINPKKPINDITDFDINDLFLFNYEPLATIKAEMAI